MKQKKATQASKQKKSGRSQRKQCRANAILFREVVSSFGLQYIFFVLSCHVLTHMVRAIESVTILENGLSLTLRQPAKMKLLPRLYLFEQ